MKLEGNKKEMVVESIDLDHMLNKEETVAFLDKAWEGVKPEI